MPPKVSNYMREEIIKASSNDSIAHVRNLMIRHGVSRIVIVERQELAGIVSMTDLLRIFSDKRLSRRPLDTIPVREVMTSDPITIDIHESVEEAARIMLKNNIGSLPVVDHEGNVRGIITRHDVIRAVGDTPSLQEIPVEEYMDKEPPKVSPFHTIYHVAEIMESKEYSKAIVVDNQSPIGVIARRDVVFIDPLALASTTSYLKRDTVLPKGKTGGVRTYLVPIAQDIMTPNPVVTQPEASIGEVVKAMISRNIGFLPVVDHEGNLVGAVTKTHVLSAYLKHR